MKCVLIGSSKSDCIIKASKYLADKYMPDFCKIYLTYDGDFLLWSAYLLGFLTYLTDDKIIFGLDDFLVASPIDMDIYNKGLSEMVDDVVCIKLCKSTEEEHKQYPVTTQFSIWDRKYLMHLLSHTRDAWNFERRGSELFDKKVLLRTCIDYNCNSSTSNRWEGYRLDGLKEEDILFLKENGYVS